MLRGGYELIHVMLLAQSLGYSLHDFFVLAVIIIEKAEILTLTQTTPMRVIKESLL